MLKPWPHQQRLLNVPIFPNANAHVNETSNDTQMQLKLHMAPLPLHEPQRAVPLSRAF